MQRKRIPGTGLSDDIDLSYEGGVGFSWFTVFNYFYKTVHSLLTGDMKYNLSNFFRSSQLSLNQLTYIQWYLG